MKLHTLRPSPGAKKKRKRIGRGNASGFGTTAGRGTKGQLSRSGGGKGPGFEGGQLPLQRRLPRLPGFTNIFKTRYQLVNIKDLERFKENTEVTPSLFYENRLVRKKNLPVKVLGEGEVKKPLTVKAHAFSKKASEAIKKAGGKVEVIGQEEARETKKGRESTVPVGRQGIESREKKSSNGQKKKKTKQSVSQEPASRLPPPESQPVKKKKDDA